MSNWDLLSERIEREYYQLRDEWREYEFEELMVDVGGIAKMKSIYNFIRQNEPFTEEQAEHFLKMDNPFQFICSRYNPPQEEMHEEYKMVIDDIYTRRITDLEDAPFFAELKGKIYKLWEEFQGLSVAYVDGHDVRSVIDGIEQDDFTISEYDSRQLLQFKNPLLVLALETGRSYEPFKKQVEQAIEVFENVDLLTYKFELEKENILPETNQRHDAIIDLMDMIPDFTFQTATDWLALNRFINENMYIDCTGIDNPYKEFLDVMNAIKEEYGDEVLQKVFDMGTEIMVQPEELVEVAKYFADGGDMEKIKELIDEDFFTEPYESQSQGGMSLC